MAAQKKYKPSITLGEVVGNQAFQLVRSGVFCKYQVSIHGIAHSGKDTTFTYTLQTDEKLTKPKQAEIVTFISGMLEMWRLTTRPIL